MYRQEKGMLYPLKNDSSSFLFFRKRHKTQRRRARNNSRSQSIDFPEFDYGRFEGEAAKAAGVEVKLHNIYIFSSLVTHFIQTLRMNYAAN